MKIINVSKNSILGTNIAIADNFFKRLFGLIPRKKLDNNEGLIIKPCNSIHTFFMSFPIDVIFVSKDNTVIYLLKNIKPWRFSKIISASKLVVELPSETIFRTNTSIGDKIEII